MNLVRLTHIVFRTYIMWAREERLTSVAYTDESAEADAETGQLALAERTWTEDELLVKTIEEVRGLSPQKQFDLGIIPVQRKWPNRFMCVELVRLFGLERISALPGFDGNGLLIVRKPADFIFPVRSDGWITRFAFYTLKEMKEWGTVRSRSSDERARIMIN